jgi:hypothetical protein
MNTSAFTAGGYEVTWAALIAFAAVAQWLVFMWSSKKEKVLISTGAFALLWLVAFDGRTLLGWKSSAATQAAMTSTRTARGSCSLITNEMAGTEVESRLGKPDEIRRNEEVRGPGAAIWIYRDSRCAVHLFDGKVEFIE